MKLSGDEVEKALYCVNEVVDRRRRAGIPTPAWMLGLARKLDLTSVMSASGHDFEGVAAESDSDLLIGPAEAADLLGLSTRQVRRLGPELGRKVGRDWRFERAIVVEYARERHG